MFAVFTCYAGTGLVHASARCRYGPPPPLAFCLHTWEGTIPSLVSFTNSLSSLDIILFYSVHSQGWMYSLGVIPQGFIFFSLGIWGCGSRGPPKNCSCPLTRMTFPDWFVLACTHPRHVVHCKLLKPPLINIGLLAVLPCVTDFSSTIHSGVSARGYGSACTHN